jgi:anti-anti-sigma regulatory factor
MQDALQLPAELTIYTAGELRPQWLDWLARSTAGEADGAGQPAPVDGSKVVDVDAAGLQLLLSLARTLAREQRPMALRAPSAALGEACRALGLAALLDGAEGAPR